MPTGLIARSLRRIRSSLPETPSLVSAAISAVVLAVAAGALSGCGGEPRSAGPSVRTRHDMAMGTLVEIKIYTDDLDGVTEVFDAAFGEIHRLEALTTPHAEDSDVFRLNAEAGRTPRQLSPEVDEMLRLGLEVSRLSEGAFDPTAGALVRAWGFPEDPALPAPEALAAAIALVDWHLLARLDAAFPIDAGGGRVERAWRLANPGMSVDLGGVAKGWAVDAAARIAAERWGNCLVNVGGDLVVHGEKPGGRPWVIGVQDPRDAAQIFLKLRLPGGMAVATSGDYQRFIEVDGERYHHILDPRTGMPSRGANSVTVVATSCALADAWATAAFVLGAEEGIRILEAMPSLEGVAVTVDVAGELVVRETSGMAALRAD